MFKRFVENEEVQNRKWSISKLCVCTQVNENHAREGKILSFQSEIYSG